MSVIKAENLTFAYPDSGENVFDSVSFQIDSDWKLGLIGRNGRGKTTFLRLLQGEFEYSGRIISSVTFDYFPYPVKDESLMTLEILQEVCPAAEDWEFLKETAGLEIEPEALYRPFSTLSNGERTKALLAALFLNEGHFLLIDEPTNHLDMHAREVVAAWLKKKKGFILVSHDRSFLDGCVDHIMSINRTDIEVVKGNFSSWWENRERQEQMELSRNRKLEKEIGRLSDAARRSAAWSDQTEKGKIGATNSGSKQDRGFVGHKAAKMMKRSQVIAGRREQAVEEKKGLLKNVETADDLILRPMTWRSGRLAELRDVSIYYDGKKAVGPVSFEINQGDRIALDGRNGSGKSSLLKLLTGQQVDHTGECTLGSGLVISYAPQDASSLSGSLQDYAEKNGTDVSLFLMMLRKLGFERAMFEKDIADFSGGQKKKVLLAGSLCREAHLYVWDEPLNYIDIYSRMQIEQLITKFSPTLIFVEHDRTFREKIATKTVHLD